MNIVYDLLDARYAIAIASSAPSAAAAPAERPRPRVEVSLRAAIWQSGAMPSSSSTAAKVGDYVDGWCTRCKLVLRHTIEAIAGGKISRVHCNTCQGQHA